MIKIYFFELIDHTCHQMKNTSRNINIHGGVEKLDPNISIPETWAENSNTNIQSSQGKNNNTYIISMYFSQSITLNIFIFLSFFIFFKYLLTLSPSLLFSFLKKSKSIFSVLLTTKICL